MTAESEPQRQPPINPDQLRERIDQYRQAIDRLESLLPLRDGPQVPPPPLSMPPYEWPRARFGMLPGQGRPHMPMPPPAPETREQFEAEPAQQDQTILLPRGMYAKVTRVPDAPDSTCWTINKVVPGIGKPRVDRHERIGTVVFHPAQGTFAVYPPNGIKSGDVDSLERAAEMLNEDYENLKSFGVQPGDEEPGLTAPSESGTPDDIARLRHAEMPIVAVEDWRLFSIRPAMSSAMLYVLLPVLDQLVATYERTAQATPYDEVIEQIRTWANMTMVQRVALEDLFVWLNGEINAGGGVLPEPIMSNLQRAFEDYQQGHGPDATAT